MASIKTVNLNRAQVRLTPIAPYELRLIELQAYNPTQKPNASEMPVPQYE